MLGCRRSRQQSHPKFAPSEIPYTPRCSDMCTMTSLAHRPLPIPKHLGIRTACARRLVHLNHCATPPWPAQVPARVNSYTWAPSLQMALGFGCALPSCKGKCPLKWRS
jgi:hypothetical protein